MRKWRFSLLSPSGGSRALGPVGWNPAMAHSIICLFSISTDLEVSVSSLSGQDMKALPARLLATYQNITNIYDHRFWSTQGTWIWAPFTQQSLRVKAQKFGLVYKRTTFAVPENKPTWTQDPDCKDVKGTELRKCNILMHIFNSSRKPQRQRRARHVYCCVSGVSCGHSYSKHCRLHVELCENGDWKCKRASETVASKQRLYVSTVQSSFIHK